jgi:formylglycine-generating enzyme required for sulfatase activity
VQTAIRIKDVFACQLDAARQQTDALFSTIRSDHLYDRPIPARHRWIFYLGHLEAFDWNQIARHELGQPASHPTLDKLFEFGIDPGPGSLPCDQPSDWPSLEEVRSYCRTSRRRIDDLFDRASAERLQIAIEHRLMHAETLAYMLHQVPYEHKIAPAPAADGAPRRPERDGSAVRIPAGPTVLGQPRNGNFGWDNEFDAHEVDVPAFSIDRYKVTNGQWLAFVRAGGPPAPFWMERDGEWRLRGMWAEFPLPLDWPVYVSQEQAAAYARWHGAELPSEAEFHRAAFGASDCLYPWGEDEPTEVHGNFDFHHWDPIPVTGSSAGDSAFGVSQLVGNGWEWTSTVFEPFQGFRPTAGYEGYSANFFDGEHYVMKGGSPRTAARLLRRSFRNWFRPDYPYIYAGFRCVQH